jgi:hypothetical protein
LIEEVALTEEKVKIEGNMKNIAYYILWGILVLLLISFSTTLLETILHARIHYYIINTVFVLALVALHYFKFRKS